MDRVDWILIYFMITVVPVMYAISYLREVVLFLTQILFFIRLLMIL